MINQLRTRNFILCYLGADSYAFVHRTFLEYFCAWEFVWQFKETQTLSIEQLKHEVFGKHWQDESWHEVLRLIAGMIDGKFVAEIIEYLLSQEVNRDDFLELRTEEQDGEIVIVDGRQTKQGLSNLLLAANCFAEIKNKAAFNNISMRLLEMLKYELLERNKSPYSHRLCLNFEAATTLATLIATLWQDNSRTLPFLKDCLNLDSGMLGNVSCVPEAVVQIIAKEWKNASETLPWLKDVANNHKNIRARRAAIQAVARGWKDDPNTLSWLKNVAQTTKFYWVGQTAIQKIVQHWKDHLDTLH